MKSYFLIFDYKSTNSLPEKYIWLEFSQAVSVRTKKPKKSKITIYKIWILQDL